MIYSHGMPSWIDLGTPNPSLAASFYSSLLGWTVNDPDNDGYRLCTLDDKLVGALGSGGEDGHDPYWTTYLNVVDIDQTLLDVCGAGGLIVEAISEAEGLGRFASVTDPRGARLTLWQPAGLTGAQLRTGTGAWVHSHLLSDDDEASSMFYLRVFGHEASTAALHRRSIGLQTRPAASSCWITLFQRDDVDERKRDVLRLGGSHIGSLNLGSLNVGSLNVGSLNTDQPLADLFIDNQKTLFGLIAVS
jgi:predicted enzyme related to lactoylglutathione lyase